MRRRKIKDILIMVMIGSLLMIGCGSAVNDSSVMEEAGSTEQTTAGSGETEEGTDGTQDDEISAASGEEESGTEEGLLVELEDLDLTDQFTKRDSKTDIGDASLIVLTDDDAVVSGSGVTADGSKVTITKAGTYIVSGSTSDGQIIIDADEDDKVQLVLDELTMTNDDGPCILVRSADKVFITLEKGSDNILSDTGAAYTQGDLDTTIDGVIFAVCDLTLNGYGSLTITAGTANGIVSKDDLVITGGTYEITSTGKGLEANDSIRIKDGVFRINSEDDGIHTSKEDTEGKGYIYIEGGTFTIASGDDGIHAGTALIINGGNILVTDSYEGLEGDSIDILDGVIEVTAEDDGLNAATSSSQDTDHAAPERGGRMKDDESGTTEGEPMERVSIRDEDSGREDTSNGDDVAEEEDASVKETKAGGRKRREGQSEEVTDEDADQKNDHTAWSGPGPGGFGGGMMDADPDAYIHISGGTLIVHAGGDGIDSNGEITISGGTVTVYGPTDNGNGALDVGTTCTINGGTAYIAGSAGMAVGFDDDSAQYSVEYTFSQVQEAGTKVTLTDRDGNVVAEMTPEKDFQDVIFSTPELQAGEYTISAGDVSAKVTVAAAD